MSREAGRTIAEARRSQGFSQARLAGLAGISRRQLASIEAGANTSIRVIERLAAVLRIPEIPLGRGVTANVGRTAGIDPGILSDRVATIETSLRDAEAGISFLRSAIESWRVRERTDVIRDEPVQETDESAGVPVVAEVSQGGPWRWNQAIKRVELDLSRIETGEIAVRFLSPGAAGEGLRDGTLLIVELRPDGRAATGELVLVLVGESAWVGRWWNKRGRRRLLTARTGRILRDLTPGEPAVILGAVTDMVHPAVRR